MIVSSKHTQTRKSNIESVEGEKRHTASHRTLKPTVFWRIAEDIPRWLSVSLVLLSVAVPAALWWHFSHLETTNEVFLPKPELVWAAAVDLAERGLLFEDTRASIIRVTLGFVFASVVSVPLGIAMGAFASIRALFEPAIGLLRYMPAPAFIPLLILYLGIEEEPKIMLIFIGTVFYNTLMVMDAVKFVPKDLIETTFTLGGNRFQTLVRVIAPYVTPNIIDAFRINIAASWNLVVIAELIAAQEGLGKRISIAQKFLRTDQIFAYLLILAVIGLTLDLSFRWILRVSSRWSFEK